MSRAVLLLLAVLWTVTGLAILAAPRTFYDLTPGVAMMSPYSVHFIRDVGLAFVASGVVTLTGAQRGDRALAFAGVVWPCLHALFHVQIWAHRGFPLDGIATFDALAVVFPALSGATVAWRFPMRAASMQPENVR